MNDPVIHLFILGEEEECTSNDHKIPGVSKLASIIMFAFIQITSPPKKMATTAVCPSVDLSFVRVHSDMHDNIEVTASTPTKGLIAPDAIRDGGCSHWQIPRGDERRQSDAIYARTHFLSV